MTGIKHLITQSAMFRLLYTKLSHDDKKTENNFLITKEVLENDYNSE